MLTTDARRRPGPPRALSVQQGFDSHTRALWAPITALIEQRFKVRVGAPPSLAETIRGTYGFPYVKVGSDWSLTPGVAEELAAALRRGNEDFCRLLIGKHLAGRQVAETASDLLKVCEEWTPDVILGDITDFAAPLVAEKLEIPIFQFDNGWAGFFGEREDLLRPALAPHRRALNLPETPVDPVPQTIFTPTPKGLLLPELPNSTVVNYQHENPRRKGESLPPWFLRFPPDKPLVYVSLGSILTRSEPFLPLLREQYSRLIDALALLDCNAIVSVGPELRRSFPQPPGSNIRIVTSVPQPLVLQCVDLFCTHGGASSLREALLAMVKLIILALSSDQLDNADRFAAHGLATLITPDDSAYEIALKMHTALITPQPTTAARKWQRRMLADPTVGKLLPRYLRKAS